MQNKVLWDGGDLEAETSGYKRHKFLLYITGNSAQYYAWVGGEFGGEWKHACVWPSPFAAHLKPSQRC